MKTNRQQQRDRNRTIAVLGVSLALIVALHALAEGLGRLGLFSLAFGIIPVLVVSQLKDWRYGITLGAFFGIVSLLTAVIKGYAGVAVWHNVINPLVSVLPRAIVGLSCSLLSTLAAAIIARYDAKHKAPAVDTPAENEAVAEEETVEDAVESAEAQPITAEDSAPVAPKTKSSVRYRKVGRFTVEYLIHAAITLVGVLLNAVGFLGMLLLFATGETVPNSDASFNLLYVLEFVVGTNTLIEAIVFTFLVPAIIQALKRAKVFR